MEEKANKLMETAKSFVEEFYFECVALRTSKNLREVLKKEEKAKRSDQMETEFQVNEQSIRDIVRAEMQRTTTSKQKRKEKAVGLAKAGDVKPRAKQQHKSRSKTRKQTANSRQANHSSSNSKKKTKPRSVLSNAGRRGRAPTKNGKGTGSGHGT